MWVIFTQGQTIDTKTIKRMMNSRMNVSLMAVDIGPHMPQCHSFLDFDVGLGQLVTTMGYAIIVNF